MTSQELRCNVKSFFTYDMMGIGTDKGYRTAIFFVKLELFKIRMFSFGLTSI